MQQGGRIGDEARIGSMPNVSATTLFMPFFSAQEYYTPKFLCDATQIGRFQTVIGAAGVEELLKASMKAERGNESTSGERYCAWA
jgi:hypothetical protein